MKFARRLLKARYANLAARFMRAACYLIMAFFAFGLALSFMGRQTFTLHTDEGIYEGAICAEESREWPLRSFTVTSADEIHVWASGGGQMDLAVRVGLALMYAADIVPLIFAYWFLSRVFANVAKGEIFTRQNALYLLYYGLTRFFTALLSPFVKLIICRLVNLFCESRVSVSTGSNMLNELIPSVAFIVAAYIIDYGIHLQDEVDHTL